MDLQGKNVLVTGITGFVGSNMARTLLNSGARVTGIVRSLNWNHDDLLAMCNVRLGDICDYGFMRDVIAQNEIDVIMHFAASAIVRISARDPLGTYATNVMGTVNILEAARNVGRCQKIIVASSDKAYGDHVDLPYLETFPLLPKNTYDASKACMDMAARAYASNYDMPIVVTRCSNVYGPGDYNRSRLIPNTILRIFQGKSAQIYNDIADMRREFIYIDDVVSACLAIVEKDASASAYNVGGTGSRKIIDVIHEIYAQFNKPVQCEILERDVSFREIREQWIDSSLLQYDSGWRPKWSLSDGLAATIDWYGRQVGFR